MPEDVMDIKQVALQMLEIAKGNLQEHGSLLPVALLVTPDQNLVTPVYFSNEEEKNRAYAELVAKAKELQAMAIVTINEVRYAKDDGSYYWGKLEAEKAPEAILVTVSGPGITNWEGTLPFERQDERFVFGELREETGTPLLFLEGWANQT